MPQPPVLGLETKHIHPGHVNRVKVFGDHLDTGIDPHTGTNKPGFQVHVDVGSANHTWNPPHHANIPPGQRAKHWIWVDTTPTRRRSARGSRTTDDLTVTVTFDDNGQLDSDTVKFCDVDFSVALATAARNQPPALRKKKAIGKKSAITKGTRKKSAKVKKPRKSRR